MAACRFWGSFKGDMLGTIFLTMRPESQALLVPFDLLQSLH